MPNDQQYHLNSYAIAAGCFLFLANETKGEVVYTDVDPDIVLNDGGQSAEIDLDNNGVSDFFFHNNSFQYYDTSWLSYRTMKNILVGPDEIGNAIAGFSASISTGYANFTRYYPFALNQASLISEVNTWQDIETQVMALRVFSDDGDLVGLGYYCYWSDFDIIDKYLGVKFNDLEGQLHYGWIRCDVLDLGRTLIIKDYAYETEPDYPIIAGDTVHYVSVLENIIDANVYSFGNNIYVNSNEQINELELNIFDTKGIIIYSATMANKNFQIELNQPKGIYVVELVSKNKIYSKKVFIS